MAIKSLIENGLHLEETVPISFSVLPGPINFTFTRDNDKVSMTIPKLNFTIYANTTLTSTNQIPESFIPSNNTMGWIIIVSNTYISCNVTISNLGKITIAGGPAVSVFTPGDYLTTGNQQVIYLV